MTVRSNRYLNNIVEQDHRAIKRRCAAMLGLKSFKTAEITLAGIELAHRIRKGQFSLGDSVHGWSRSLKQQWDMALTPGRGESRPVVRRNAESTFGAPELKRRCAMPLLTEEWIHEIRSGRYARKISDGRGLYLLVGPNGSRYWRYNYRFQRKSRTLALGVYPDVSLETARARHQEARCLLADGVDPSTRRAEFMSTARLRLRSSESWPLERKRNSRQVGDGVANSSAPSIHSSTL